MKSLADIMWSTMQGHYRQIVENVCREYETNPKYTLFKIVEDGELAGFFCYYDDRAEGYRMLEGGYYTGKNPFTALRMFKKMKQGARVLRACVQKSNGDIWRTYLHIGFRVIREDLSNYLLEWRA